VRNVTGSDNSEVGSNVVGLMEVFNLLFCDITYIFSDSQNWLSHEVISIRSIVNSFSSGLFLIFLIFDAISINSFSFSFYLIFIVYGV